MKKTQDNATNAENLETKFDRGEEVLGFFDLPKAKVTSLRSRAGTSFHVQSAVAEQVVVRNDRGENRIQSTNPKTGNYTKRNETRGSKTKGEFMDNKKGGKPFKGVAREPDKRRG